MKKIVAVTLAVFALFSVLCLTGCGEKTSITADEFKASMETEGAVVVDITDQYTEISEILSAHVALLGSGDHQIEFYVFDSDQSAHNAYLNNKNIFEQSISDNYSKTNSSLANYDRLVITADGYYKVLSRIDSTFVYVNVSTDYKDEVKGLLDSIGY